MNVVKKITNNVDVEYALYLKSYEVYDMIQALFTLLIPFPEEDPSRESARKLVVKDLSPCRIARLENLMRELSIRY